MRGFKALGYAQRVCAGHGFVRDVREGFYRLGLVMGDPRIPGRHVCYWYGMN
jgi:hypothetical protein